MIAISLADHAYQIQDLSEPLLYCRDVDHGR
jgi:hypothetical protein